MSLAQHGATAPLQTAAAVVVQEDRRCSSTSSASSASSRCSRTARGRLAILAGEQEQQHIQQQQQHHILPVCSSTSPLYLLLAAATQEACVCWLISSIYLALLILRKPPLADARRLALVNDALLDDRSLWIAAISILTVLFCLSIVDGGPRGVLNMAITRIETFFPPPPIYHPVNTTPISPLVQKMKQQFLSLDIPLPSFPSLLSTSSSTNEAEALPQNDFPELVCWFLDTRELWPGENIDSAKGAAHALSLISEEEQKAIRGKMFIADARMSLGSALLKRLFISKALNISWEDVKLARKGNEKHGKPCAVDNRGRPISGIDFNVSHQNGLVALIGWNGRRSQHYSPNGHIQGVLSPGLTADDVMVGVDIVCVNERENAAQTIDAEGFDGWVDIYDAVFSVEERWSMKYDVDAVTLLDGTRLSAAEIGRNDRCIQRNRDLTCTTKSGEEVTFSSELLIDAKIRRFYTYFCYKEAYIKLAGEGLLAPWLKKLEFFNVRSPRPGTPARCSTHGTWGEEIDDCEVRLHGRVVDDVKMKVQAFEEDFMISTAIQGAINGMKIPAFQKLHLDKDVLNIARETLERKDSFMSPQEAIAADESRKAPMSAADVESLLSPWESRYW